MEVKSRNQGNYVNKHVSFLLPAYVVRREGTVFTGVCLFTGIDRHLPSPGPRYPKVPTPSQVRMGEGVPQQGTYPPPRPGQDGEGVPQGTYLPARSGWGDGYPKVRTPQPGRDGGRGTPRYLSPARSGWEGYSKVGIPRPRTFLFIKVST